MIEFVQYTIIFHCDIPKSQRSMACNASLQVQGYVSIGSAQAALVAAAAATRDEMATHSAAVPLPCTSTLAHAGSTLASTSLTAACRSLHRVPLLTSALRKPAAVVTGSKKGQPTPADCVSDELDNFGCVADSAEALLATLWNEIGASTQRMASVSADLVSSTTCEGLPPTLAAATAAATAVELLVRCCALEALMATVVLKRIRAGTWQIVRS
jgi:hypothetical protein